MFSRVNINSLINFDLAQNPSTFAAYLPKMKANFLLLYMICALFACKSNQSSKSHMDHKYTNSLINETSPYLLQHAHNPVNWYPWGDEAFKKAKDEDKMIIVSVGYSSCHWCHVMEHESFEDSLVAQIMNENFVCIKVDREERPDVDDVYMTACRLITGRGGWPLNAFALADGKPFYAGTYYSKEEWTNLLEQFIQIKKEDPEKLTAQAEQVTQGIQSSDELQVVTAKMDFTKGGLAPIANVFKGLIDYEEGGRKGAPKFPLPNNYEFLLKYAHHAKDAKALEAVTTTLDKMALGGIYDQLGGGFSRYSTDKYWLAPHFEKMTYDNGQLVSLYSQAYRLTKKPLYKEIVEHTLAYTKREMTSKETGFYSALDADSEGEEGKFYTWSKAEIDSIIGDEKQAELYNAYYNVKKNGNWEHVNILHITKGIASVAKDFSMPVDQAKKIIADINTKLFAHRSKRIRPGLDDKILTAWNAIMMKGYIDAYLAFGNEEYLETAIRNAEFILNKQIQKDNRILHTYKDGKSTINGFLDDYALTIDAFIALYQATFDEKWLSKANDLMAYVQEHFYNAETTMYNYTSSIDPPLIAKKSEYADNVIPGSNSITARNLYNLGTLLYKPAYLEKSTQMLKNMVSQISTTEMPGFYSNWLQLYLDKANPPYEIAILGDDALAKRKELHTHYLGNAFLLGGKTEGSLALLKDKLQEDETYIYVCQNKVCKLPVTEVEKALELAKPE